MYNVLDLPHRYNSITEYESARSAVTRAEDSLAFDREASITSTPVERSANKVVQELKRKEAEKLCKGGEHDSGRELGQEYSHAKKEIDNSIIAELAREAPKGALLHCHFDGMLSPSLLLEFARGASCLHIKVAVPLDHPAAFQDQPFIEFTTLCHGKALLHDRTDCFLREYTPFSWMRYSTFLERFPDGPRAAERWIASKISFNVERSGKWIPTVDRCLSCYVPFNMLFIEGHLLIIFQTVTGYSLASAFGVVEVSCITKPPGEVAFAR